MGEGPLIQEPDLDSLVGQVPPQLLEQTLEHHPTPEPDNPSRATRAGCNTARARNTTHCIKLNIINSLCAIIILARPNPTYRN